MRIAEPSSSVLTTTRTAISVERRDRKSISPVRASAGQLRNEAENRHVHGDDDAADDAPEKRDHEWLHQREQAGHCHVYFLFVKVRNLAEHRVQRAGGL